MSHLKTGVLLTAFSEPEISSGFFSKVMENSPVNLFSRMVFYPLSPSNLIKDETAPKLLRYCNELAYGDTDATKWSEMDLLICDDRAVAEQLLTTGKPVYFLSAETAVSYELPENPEFSYLSVLKGEGLSIQLQRLFLWISLAGPRPVGSLINPFIISLEGENHQVEFKADKLQDIDAILEKNNCDYKHISIETTSVCNLRCSYCPNSIYEREKEFMTSSLYYRLIDSIVEYTPHFCGMLSLNLYGEPLLDNILAEFVAFDRPWLPIASIHINTNGMFLDLERYLRLVHAGVDWFCITQHTATPSAVLSDTLTTITRDYPHMARFSYSEGVREFFNRGGLLDIPVAEVPDIKFERCNAYRDLAINVKGDVVLCCNDYLGQHSFGNAGKQSIGRIWNENRYCGARNLLMFGFLPFQMCRKCICLKKEN